MTFFSLMALHAGRDERWEPLISKGMKGVHTYQKETREEIAQQFSVSPVMDTAYAVRALCQAGVPSRSPEIRPSLSWLAKCQNQDGGWGESVESYERRRFAAAPRSAAQTAIVLLGLLSVGAPRKEIRDRGIRYLLAAQSPGGGWDDSAFFATNIPRVWYGRYELLPTFFALMALCTCREAL